ncbi:MAG: GNAT family N-acetyltransferase [Leptolyngbya sp. SIO1E4]|nr:GNAT family N-acetyltransferase [Leptolyngbya sp. SIO1E4]
MKHPMSSKHLRIRRFEQGDIEDFVSFMTDPDSTRFLTFGEAQKNREGATALLEATIESYKTETPLMAFAVEDQTTGQFVGFCGLTPREADAVEIMYAVMPSARGQGYATEVATTLAQYAVRQLGYRRVFAPIAPEHEISKTVAIKAGFIDHGLHQNSDVAKKVHLFIFEQAQPTPPYCT